MGASWILIIAWIVFPFAVFRMARLVSQESGPFDVFFRFRHRVGVYDVGENDEPVSFWGKLFVCPLCTGVYITLFLLILLLLNWTASNLFIIWMGIAGIQTYLYLRSE